MDCTPTTPFPLIICPSQNTFSPGQSLQGYWSADGTFHTEDPEQTQIFPPNSPCPEICSPPIIVCPPSSPRPQECSPWNPFTTCPTSPSDSSIFEMQADFATTSPSPTRAGWGSPSRDSTAEDTDQRVLQRGRAPPGMFPDFDLIDVPGMGFPIPKAALERGGRQRGEVPLSPTSPPPRQMGRFRPLASSSFLAQSGVGVGSLRSQESSAQLPPDPMDGQEMDPALLPKIQGDLYKLSERNRKLQNLVNDFKRIRAKITDEIDKAVKLNQKLQRDLYYVAEAYK